MWLLNLRGQDMPLIPVALCFMILSRSTADLFLQKGEVDEQPVCLHEDSTGSSCTDMRMSYDYLRDYHFEGRVYLDRKGVSDSLFDLSDR